MGMAVGLGSGRQVPVAAVPTQATRNDADHARAAGAMAAHDRRACTHGRPGAYGEQTRREAAWAARRVAMCRYC